MRRHSRLLFKYIPPAILVVSLTAIYLCTMAPGLTWANGGSDGGDLIAAAATGGVAHPTGYPLYLLLARFFQLLPVGTLAFRTNLLSALATVMAALLIYGIVTRSAPGLHPEVNQLAGLIAGFAFGVSPLAWSQAVITEVYAVHALFVALILYLITVSAQQRQRMWTLGIVLGLAAGNHVTTILLMPPALLVNTIQRRMTGEEPTKHSVWRNWELDWKSLGILTGSMGIGLSNYLLLPLWASTHPPINWGNPVTPERFFWLVSGQLYREQMFDLAPWNMWERLQGWAGLLVQQFGLPGLILALIGLVVLFKPTRLHLITIWTALIFSTFAIFYNVIDWYVFLIPSYIALAIWIGLGSARLMFALSRHNRIWNWFVGFICIFYLIGSTIYYWDRVDASGDMRAERFGYEVLSALPEHAIVFADGDRTIFTLWYFHFALQNRPDVFILATDLLPFDWYRKTLQVTYPGLVVPQIAIDTWQTAIVRSNPFHPVCYPYFDKRTVVNCQ